WGVGTRLATAYDQPALGGVFKLSAFREAGGSWRPVIKLSEERLKISVPGIQQIRRFSDSSGFVADVVWDEQSGISEPCIRVDENGREIPIPGGAESEDLLVPVMRRGRVVYDSPPLEAIRRRSLEQVQKLDDGVRRLVGPDPYAVGLDLRLHRLRERLIAQLQAGSAAS
ncbi:MAG: nicotinate phosphoribosyltransferase, partial [bacterium]|nr:nicotinate phosphoribosyltransferase [bacterium]